MNERLRQEKDNVNWNDKDSVIDFYESNILYFDNYELQKSPKLIEEIAETKIAYILALDIKKHFSKADKILRHVDILVQKLKNTDSFDKINEYYMYASGVIAQRMKRYEESQDYFNQLLKIDPDNDLYRDWHSANKQWLLYQKSKIVGYAGIGLYLLTMIASVKFTFEESLENRIEIIAILMMALGFFAPQIDKMLKKIFKTYK